MFHINILINNRTMPLFRPLVSYVLRKIRVLRKKAIVKKERELLGAKEFVIISDNCWGGAAYQWYDKPYNSPFVGLGIYGECYIKLLSNFDHYINLPLEFKPQQQSKHAYRFKEEYYPMAVLEDIEIHFVHYQSIEEVLSKWTKRKDRMLKITNKDQYFFKMCDDWKANSKQIQQFHQLPFKNKISFVPNTQVNIQSAEQIAVYQRHARNKVSVPNGLGLFKITFLYFDLSQWLSRSKIVRTFYKG
jgi:uncharacterized protein (DUF1919 family)